MNKQSAKVVIIGGGITGLSIAYHLGKLGWTDVLVLERNHLTSGTSWHAAGIVGPLRANLNLTKLAMYATELFSSLEQETGQATGYQQTGGMWLAQTTERMIELKRIGAMGDVNGLSVKLLSAGEAREAMPLMRVDDLVGALWVDEDGQTNPVDTCLAFAKGAKASGVRILEKVKVTTINIDKGAVHSVCTDHPVDGETKIRCGYIVNCAGAWARQVGDLAGVDVPLQAVEHMYIVTEPIPDLPKPCPVLRDLDNRIYIKEDAGKIVLGGFESDAKLWHPPVDGSEGEYLMLPEDYEQFESHMQAGLNRIPVLEKTGIQHFMNGPESFTPDTSQLMGESPQVKNFFVAAGLNSIGIMSSAGVGRAMAGWIADGEPPMDLWAVDIARADPKWNADRFLHERIPEAVGNQLDMHWPHKQMKTGRDLRRSPLYETFKQAGAVFGVTGGWERPFWFSENEEESEWRYSYRDQSWWPAARRESDSLKNGVALLELSPFSKFRITGIDAEAALQRLCTADISVDINHIVYTLMLNNGGGVQAEVTVRRAGESEFWIISGAATRWKDNAWIDRLLSEQYQAQLEDLTEDYAVLGVFGPDAGLLMQAIVDQDLSSDGFLFATAKQIEIAGVSVVAQRLSFVGEFGFELYIPAAFAEKCYDEIITQGENFSLRHAGFFCLDASRLEKGYKHWGHDIGTEDSPIEAGLSFALDLKKSSGFIGKQSILEDKKVPTRRHLLLFKVQGAHPLLLHDEPIYRNNEFVGLTTSGGRCFRTDMSLCFAYVKTKAGESKRELYSGEYEVAVAGERFSIVPLEKPPYDPTGSRMRGS